ncbi:MAG TPA: DHH family phosphoesterase [Candidatus Saccharimonadales bacterium]|nr:DHH family phosphoesterase [Candidatus Saccharimonadales bacterium]
MYPEADQIKTILGTASTIVIVQADNPDADSLGSALALEYILGDMGKQPYMYCAVDIPDYLHYLNGWDRVQKDLPSQFDASIIVDASTLTLFEKLANSGQQGWLASKPCIVLDHHEVVENPISFATVSIVDHQRASAGELIYLIAKQLDWPMSADAQGYLMNSILGDTQGLTNQLASAETYRIMAEMIDAGVSRTQLEEQRREYSKMAQVIFKYKAELINRTRFDAGGSIASVDIPQSEINEYSPLYNPAPLIQNDMLQTVGVRLTIVFKHYDDGRVTAAIRAANDAPVAAQLAEEFGGGGHAYAAGFKDTSGKPFEEIRDRCLSKATELLAKLVAES